MLMNMRLVPHTYTHTPKRAAFTLVELLVVISIIALLSTIAVTAMGSARKQARNTKRISDIKQLATAFYLAYNNNGSYPAGGWACVTTACTGGWVSIGADSTIDGIIFGSNGYMAAKPTDPTGDAKTYGGYVYASNYTPPDCTIRRFHVSGRGISGLYVDNNPRCHLWLGKNMVIKFTKYRMPHVSSSVNLPS